MSQDLGRCSESPHHAAGHSLTHSELCPCPFFYFFIRLHWIGHNLQEHKQWIHDKSVFPLVSLLWVFWSTVALGCRKITFFRIISWVNYTTTRLIDLNMNTTAQISQFGIIIMMVSKILCIGYQVYFDCWDPFKMFYLKLLKSVILTVDQIFVNWKVPFIARYQLSNNIHSHCSQSIGNWPHTAYSTPNYRQNKS